MKQIIGLFLLLCSEPILAQHPYTLHLIQDETRQPIPGVTISIFATNISPAKKANTKEAGSLPVRIILSDSIGQTLLPALPAGRYQLQCTAVGFLPRQVNLSLPIRNDDTTLTISLDPAIQTLQDVVISSTRTNQLLKNTPLTVQVIDREDIDESTGQSPANIHELLTEMSGTRVQITSAVSGNAVIRLQGLDGRYTQLLKDGFPLYGGFSGSLSILQVPPLDLRQVEVIKGAGSALYGGDAIAGIINLVSRIPDTTLHLDAIANQTQRGGTDLAGFYSRRDRHTGLTLLATGSRQPPIDVNKDGFTDLPRIRQGTLAPTFFWYPDDSTLIRLGINISAEDRTGGNLKAVRSGVDSLHTFLQKNHTNRDYYQLSLQHKGPHHQVFSLKNSMGYFYRSITQTTGASPPAIGTPPPIIGLNSFGFSGTEISSFTEASYSISTGSHQGVAGLNLATNQFHPETPHQNLAYRHNTVGAFLQDDWKLSQSITLESGLRIDREQTNYFLPRLALLYKPTGQLSVRAGGGLAYKLPTLFNARDEEDAYQQVYPITPTVRAERSASVNLSISYQGRIGDDLRCSLDENVYYTRLTRALLPQADSLRRGWLYYINAPGPVTSIGSETNARFTLDDLSLNIGFTYTDARRLYLPGNPSLPLTPRSRLSTSLVYEAEPHWKTGIEGFFTGDQYLDNGDHTSSFWTFDMTVQRSWGPFSILLNLENFTDTRQSRFGPLYTGTTSHPVFNEIYAPLEGRIVSLAFRYSR